MRGGCRGGGPKEGGREGLDGGDACWEVDDGSGAWVCGPVGLALGWRFVMGKLLLMEYDFNRY